MAYVAVGNIYDSLEEVGRASEYYTKAFQLREHASEREKLMIIGDYYEAVTGELEKSIQIYQEEIEIYPREGVAYLHLSAAFAALGQISELRRS